MSLLSFISPLSFTYAPGAPLPLFLSCASQNDSMVESNQEDPPESLNTLLTDISLVSQADRQSPSFSLIKMDTAQGRNEEGWEKKSIKRKGDEVGKDGGI